MAYTLMALSLKHRLKQKSPPPGLHDGAPAAHPQMDGLHRVQRLPPQLLMETSCDPRGSDSRRGRAGNVVASTLWLAAALVASDLLPSNHYQTWFELSTYRYAGVSHFLPSRLYILQSCSKHNVTATYPRFRLCKIATFPETPHSPLASSIPCVCT